MIEITKEFCFEGAHSLMGYDGKCCHIHGHSYKLYVTVEGNPISDILQILKRLYRKTSSVCMIMP